MIALLDAHNDNYNDIAAISVPNRIKYCKKHGYKFVEYKFTKLQPPNRTPHWGRVMGLKTHLDQYDWIFYCDTDAVILNESIKIEKFIDENYDLIVGPLASEGHLSSSGMLIKNCEWSRKLFDTWYNQTYFINHPYHAKPGQDYGATAGNGGMFFEQSALEFLYDTNEEIRKRIKRIKRNAFNSIASSAYYYKPGDFLIHFPGVPKQQKIDLMKQWSKKSVKIL